MRPTRLPSAGLSATVALGLVLTWAATRQSFFVADDWPNLAQARDLGLGGDLLRLGYFGHFAPGHRVLDWMVARPFPASWPAYLTLMLALYAVAIVAFRVLLQQVTVPPRVALVATALFAFSVVWTRVIQWPASAGHIVPATAATLVSLAASAAWMRRPRVRLLVVAAGGMAVGLAFYEKPVLVIGYVVLLRLVLLPRLSLRSAASACRRDAPLLLALGAVALVYAVLVLRGGYTNVGGAVSASVWVDYLWSGWTDGTITMLVGQGSPDYAGPISPALRVLAQVVLALLVVTSLRRSPSAWRAWVFLLVVWAVNAALVGAGRLSSFGVGIAQDPRYYAEMAYLLPLALALAFRSTGPERTHVSWVRALNGRPLAVLAASAVVLFVLSTVDAVKRIETSWGGRDARTWAQQIRATVPPARDAAGRLTIFDADAPFSVVAGAGPPFNRLSAVLPVLVGSSISFDGVGAVPATVDSSGTVRRLRLSPVTEILGADVTPTPKVLAGTPRTTAPEICAGETALSLLVSRTMDVPLAAMLRVELNPQPAGAGTIRALEIRVDRGAGLPADYERAVLVHPGVAQSGVLLDPGPVDAIGITVPARTCLRAASLVTLS